MLASGVQIGTPMAYQNWGNVLEVCAGGLSTGISLAALRTARGRTCSLPAAPNMLARIFDLPDNEPQRYPHSIWLYLSDSTTGRTGGKSRREELIDKWIRTSDSASSPMRT